MDQYYQALIAQLMKPQMNDQPSPADQANAYQNMVQQRSIGSMNMLPISPYSQQDKLAIQPNNVQSYRMSPSMWGENI